MERELWPLLYRLLRAVAKDFDQKYVTGVPPSCAPRDCLRPPP
jgi:hypothetical protein